MDEPKRLTQEQFEAARDKMVAAAEKNQIRGWIGRLALPCWLIGPALLIVAAYRLLAGDALWGVLALVFGTVLTCLAVGWLYWIAGRYFGARRVATIALYAHLRSDDPNPLLGTLTTPEDDAR